MLIELFSVGVTAEVLQANIDWKSAFLKGGWSVSAKFLGNRRCSPANHFCTGR